LIYLLLFRSIWNNPINHSIVLEEICISMTGGKALAAGLIKGKGNE
jgi:hypothetical protein